MTRGRYRAAARSSDRGIIMTDIRFNAIRRGQFAAAQEFTADGVESWRLVRVVKASKAGAVREYAHPADYCELEQGRRRPTTRRDSSRRVDGLDADYNDVMARATAGLTQSDLTYESKRELQLDVLRMLGYQEHQLAEAGARMAAAARGKGKSIVVSEYLHTAD